MLWVLRVRIARIALIVLLCRQNMWFPCKIYLKSPFPLIILVDCVSFTTIINFLWYFLVRAGKKCFWESWINHRERLFDIFQGLNSRKERTYQEQKMSSVNIWLVLTRKDWTAAGVFDGRKMSSVCSNWQSYIIDVAENKMDTL